MVKLLKHLKLLLHARNRVSKQERLLAMPKIIARQVASTVALKVELISTFGNDCSDVLTNTLQRVTYLRATCLVIVSHCMNDFLLTLS